MSTSELKKHGVMSKEQKVFLIQFLEDHPELKTGKFTQNFTFKKAQTLWRELSEDLNAMPGCKKEWEKWRKTWHDMKNAVKSKGAAIKKHQSATGGGPAITTELTEEDQRIFGLIAPVAIEGHEIQESQAIISTEEHNDNQKFEHDYSTTPSIIVIDKCDENNVTQKCSGQKENAVRNISKRSRIQRLESTIAVSDRMADQMERKITYRKNYFRSKLLIMKRDVAAKLRIASALEVIARALQNSPDQ